LIIEVDGGHHDRKEHIFYDDDRTECLENYGMTILRFKNEEVLKDIDHVLFVISEKICSLRFKSKNGRAGKKG
jgi:very-short-patch-repair endonuclease